MGTYRMKWLATALAVTFGPALVHAANVYKCKDDKGGIVFTDKKCEYDAAPQRIWDSQLGPPSVSYADPVWCDDGAAEHAAIQSCLELWRPSLRDPRSAYAESGSYVHNQNTGERAVFVNGHAKNGFGGFNSLRMTCGVDDEGAVSASASAEWLKLAEAFATLGVTPTLLPVRACGK